MKRKFELDSEGPNIYHYKGNFEFVSAPIQELEVFFKICDNEEFTKEEEKVYQQMLIDYGIVQ